MNKRKSEQENVEERLFMLDLLRLNKSIDFDGEKYYPEKSVINIIRQALKSN